MNVLFVCLGNICRSPIAEGILKKKFQEKNIKGIVESAGFESFHINDVPDERAVKVTAKHGIDISKKRARLFRAEDFDRFDSIWVMDQQNMQDILLFARHETDKAKVDFLLNLIDPGSNKAVADPYYSGIDACEDVFTVIEQACEKIVEIASK